MCLWRWLACPLHCYECTYDSSRSLTICADGRCHADYANAPDGGCGGKTENCLLSSVFFLMPVETFYFMNPFNKCIVRCTSDLTRFRFCVLTNFVFRLLWRVSLCVTVCWAGPSRRPKAKTNFSLANLARLAELQILPPTLPWGPIPSTGNQIKWKNKKAQKSNIRSLNARWIGF